jgi:hypothetical protein
MKPIERSEILDFVTYTEHRDRLRASAMQAKALRRMIVGDVFTFLFENRETVRYQIQEMVRVEKIVKEADIAHEIATYNELLGSEGSVGVTLLIGIEDERERDEKLHAWLGLLDHVYARLADGTQVRPRWDPRQVGDTRLSSVQYLRFPLGGRAPIAVGIDMPGIERETTLSDEQHAALQSDLDERP